MMRCPLCSHESDADGWESAGMKPRTYWIVVTPSGRLETESIATSKRTASEGYAAMTTGAPYNWRHLANEGYTVRKRRIELEEEPTR